MTFLVLVFIGSLRPFSQQLVLLFFVSVLRHFPKSSSGAENARARAGNFSMKIWSEAGMPDPVLNLASITMPIDL